MPVETAAGIEDAGEAVVDASEADDPDKVSVEASVETSGETADEADAPEMPDSDDAPVDSEPELGGGIGYHPVKRRPIAADLRLAR